MLSSSLEPSDLTFLPSYYFSFLPSILAIFFAIALAIIGGTAFPIC